MRYQRAAVILSRVLVHKSDGFFFSCLWGCEDRKACMYVYYVFVCTMDWMFITAA